MRLQDRDKRYTVEEYLALPDGPPCELIRGELRPCLSAPSKDRDRALIALGSLIVGFLRAEGADREGSSCGVFVEPVDVVLAADTVVHPDIVVVCDLRKLANDRYVDGAPELVVEVAAAETGVGLRTEKRALYEQAGVDEYVIVAPEERRVQIYRQSVEGGFAAPEMLRPADMLTFRTIPLLEVPVCEVFGWPSAQQETE
ncbi:MAG: Uma2 family endonuclease [Rhodospirillales bacterium]|nr:Uma2 family endonuclease [Rhodospirillales bacterium]